MYAKIENGAVIKYPYNLGDLYADNPDTSFPDVIPVETLALYGVYVVVEIGAPDYDPVTQSAVVSGCAFNQTTQEWEQVWEVRSKTAEEMKLGVINEIQKLESLVTPRRIREAVLGIDGGWLADIEARISTMRKQLV